MKILITGGTLDKQYNPLNGELGFNKSSVADMLTRSNNTLATDVEVLMLKDSLEMNDQDRQQIADACGKTDDQQILITHGTDTMVETAHAVANSRLINKTVVLLGAMVPYQIQQSDALFNLGCAITAVQLLPAGVYITMNGQVFDYREVEKNRAQGIFVKSNLVKTNPQQ